MAHPELTHRQAHGLEPEMEADRGPTPTWLHERKYERALRAPTLRRPPHAVAATPREIEIERKL